MIEFKRWKYFFAVWCWLPILLQFLPNKDSIYIEAKIPENKRQITVYQDITYYNHSETDLDQIKLLNWISAYKTHNTSTGFTESGRSKKRFTLCKTQWIRQSRKSQHSDWWTNHGELTDQNRFFFRFQRSLRPEKVKSL